VIHLSLALANEDLMIAYREKKEQASKHDQNQKKIRTEKKSSSF
jgi:hypothetical protein